MGKKYIIELLDNCQSEFKEIIVFGLTPSNQISAEPIPVEDLTPYTEPDLDAIRKEAYEEGRKVGIKDGMCEAWEAARFIADMPYGEEEKAFGSGGWAFIVKHTASEAIEKIRQYEQEKEEIKVGDEVIPHHITADSTPVIVTRKWKDDYNQDAIHTIGYDGRTNCFLEEYVEKTGRHFEIAEILAKMKESANEN